MLDTDRLTRKLSGITGPYAGAKMPVGPLHKSPTLFLSDAHKLLRPDLLAALAPDMTPTAPDYSSEETYDQYAVVGSESQLYESLVHLNKGYPLEDSLAWRPTTMLSSWYGRIERGSISKLALMLAGAPPAAPIIDRQPLYGKEANLSGAVSRFGRFVGVRISARKRNLAIKLLRIGLQLTGPVINLPLFLFHSSQASPVAIMLLNGSTSGRTVWADTPAVLAENDGYYLLGYYESDLPLGVLAVGAQRGWDVSGCSSCFGSDYALAAARGPLVKIESVYVMMPTEYGVMNWATEQSVNLQTWGLNAIIDVRCDATSLLLDNEDLLLNGLLHQIACDVLEEISTSDRVNSVAAQIKPQAYVALNGQANAKSDIGVKGERNKVVSELKGVLATVSDCIKTEAPRKGITIGTMFD